MKHCILRRPSREQATGHRRVNRRMPIKLAPIIRATNHRPVIRVNVAIHCWIRRRSRRRRRVRRVRHPRSARLHRLVKTRRNCRPPTCTNRIEMINQRDRSKVLHRRRDRVRRKISTGNRHRPVPTINRRNTRPLERISQNLRINQVLAAVYSRHNPCGRCSIVLELRSPHLEYALHQEQTEKQHSMPVLHSRSHC